MCWTAPADLIEALSCVFRAGRQGANTDHSSILFDVDVNTGLIKEGSTNAHWYQLGLDKMFNCSWRSTYLTPEHPDCKKRIAGACWPHAGEKKMSRVWQSRADCVQRLCIMCA
jgi:hypothetical protein